MSVGLILLWAGVASAYPVAHAIEGGTATYLTNGKIEVPASTTTCVLLQSTALGQDVKLRILSGPLRGSLVEGSFCDDQWVFIKIENIRTPSGSDVDMPICKCADWQGPVKVPRVQIDAPEWRQVRNGGVASAGSTFHLRILAPVQFDGLANGYGDGILASTGTPKGAQE